MKKKGKQRRRNERYQCWQMLASKFENPNIYICIYWMYTKGTRHPLYVLRCTRNEKGIHLQSIKSCIVDLLSTGSKFWILFYIWQTGQNMDRKSTDTSRIMVTHVAPPACGSDASIPDALNNFYSQFNTQNTLTARKTKPPLSDQVLHLTTADVKKTLQS